MTLQKRLTGSIRRCAAHKVVLENAHPGESKTSGRWPGFIEQGLRAEGHAVTVRHDGDSGEAAALTGDYALVLLDLMLPGKPGLAVLEAIRARLPDLPVIVLTARAAIEQKVAGAGSRRERLRDQAVLVRGAAGAGARAAASARPARRVRARGGRHPHGSAHAPRASVTGARSSSPRASSICWRT